MLPQFCGATIAGLSLLSPSVMRLVHTQEPGEWLELLLEPGSLYILRYCPAKQPPPYRSRVGPPLSSWSKHHHPPHPGHSAWDRGAFTPPSRSFSFLLQRLSPL